MRMIIVNEYGDEIAELEPNGDTGFWKVKSDDVVVFKYLAEGDKLEVRSVWTEEE